MLGHILLECFKNDNGIIIFWYFKIPQHFKTFPPTFLPIHTNYVVFMCQDFQTFKPQDLS
jgi:hypothetical protein